MNARPICLEYHNQCSRMPECPVAFWWTSTLNLLPSALAWKPHSVHSRIWILDADVLVAILLDNPYSLGQSLAEGALLVIFSVEPSHSIRGLQSHDFQYVGAPERRKFLYWLSSCSGTLTFRTMPGVRNL